MLISAACCLLALLRIANQRTKLLAIGVWPQIQHFRYRIITFGDQAIAQLLKLMKQYNLLVVTVFQLVQRLTDRINIALAQHFANQLQLAAATFHLNTLGQLNRGT